MRNLLLARNLFFVLCLSSMPLMAQNKPFPLESYEELPNPTPTDLSVWKNVKGTNAAWGTTDVRYKKEEPPFAKQKAVELTAWKGERVNAQFVIWGDRDINELSFHVSELADKTGNTIQGDRLLCGFVRYVMTDEIDKDGKSGCGSRADASLFDSTLVADPIDHINKTLRYKAHTTQPAWVRVWVPQDAQPGIYTGQVEVRADGEKVQTLALKVQVKNRTLPEPSQWAFHLDLWQNPFAIARYYNVPLWSDRHFEAMRPIMELYSQAGGKVVTASIIHKPWNGQTYDYFESMVTWIKKADGTWAFDYTVFDRWVEFMRSVGVTKEIDCYSMIPWKLSFKYFDQASNSMQTITTQPGEKAYSEMWTAMLKSFAAHLKEKGWFDITHISMDERSLEAMLETLKVIKGADPGFKISMAGNLYKELIGELDNYCATLRHKFTPQEVESRRAEGRVTTFYTCCAEPYPNTFTFSDPAQAEWLAWYAAKEQLDGYLRWAYNSWVKQPLTDSRFVTWAGGDTYLVYPGGRTSIRFERLTEGIQAYEKVRILKQELTGKGDKAALRKIEQALSQFKEADLPTTPADKMVNRAKAVINKY